MSAVARLISRKRIMLKHIVYNGKIADINESDTNKHTLDLETALTETRKIVLLILGVYRISGSGSFYTYPNEGTDHAKLGDDLVWQKPVMIADGSQRVQYNQDVANDDFDLYCFGYFVEA